MPKAITYKAFGCPRGWKVALPWLDWECFVLAALDAALVHLVLASAIREAKSSSNVELALGSERNRKGLEVVCSHCFNTKMQDKTTL